MSKKKLKRKLKRALLYSEVSHRQAIFNINISSCLAEEVEELTGRESDFKSRIAELEATTNSHLKVVHAEMMASDALRIELNQEKAKNHSLKSLLKMQAFQTELTNKRLDDGPTKTNTLAR